MATGVSQGGVAAVVFYALRGGLPEIVSKFKE